MVENQADDLSGWERREQPPLLYRRFQFDSYKQTRAFLDKLAEISKQQSYYPDSSFGATYANITIHPRNGKALTADDQDFAARATALFDVSRPT